MLEGLEERSLLSGTPVFSLDADFIGGTVTAGVPAKLTVRALNFNTAETFTGYAGTVTFRSGYWGTPDELWAWHDDGALPASYTFQPADLGVHTFTALYSNPRLQGLSVTDEESGVSHSFNFDVPPPAPTALALSAPDRAVPGRPFQITVTAQGADGQAAAGYAGTVHFTSTDPKAILPPDYTFSPGAGSATFTVTLASEGRQTLTVTDLDAGLTASRGLDVRKNTATHFLVQMTNPTEVLRGIGTGMTVTAVDDSGVVDQGYVGTVHFTSSDPQAELPADYTFTTADAGRGSFSLKMNTVGAQTVTAAEMGGSLTGTTPVTVKAVRPDHFKISAPESVKAGVPFQVTVTALKTILDYSGTHEVACFDYTGSVRLESNNTMNATAWYTFSEADNGIHTFTVTLNTVGEDLLTVREWMIIP